MHTVAEKGIGNIVSIDHFRKQKEIDVKWGRGKGKISMRPGNWSSGNPSTHFNIIGRSLEATTTIDPINSCTNFEAIILKLFKQTLNFPIIFGIYTRCQ